MKEKYLGIRTAFAMVLCAGLSACGSNHTPIAFKTVQPTEDLQQLAADSVHPLTLLDVVIQQGVPEKVATLAFSKYDAFQSFVKNTRYMSIIDFTQHSGKLRYYMINMNSGHVDKLPVAHGVNSDRDNDGIATEFSNTPDSRQSSLGAYIVAEKFLSGSHGDALRLDGLESSNSMVRSRDIIVHSAAYVEAGRDKQGRSWGCPAVPMDWIAKTIDRLRDGSFMYAYGKSVTPLMPEADLRRMVTDPSFRWLDESAAPVDGE